MLLGRRSGDVSTTLVSWANRSVGVQSCPTPPRRPAVRPDPTRPWYVRVLDSTNILRNNKTIFVSCNSRNITYMSKNNIYSIIIYVVLTRPCFACLRAVSSRFVSISTFKIFDFRFQYYICVKNVHTVHVRYNYSTILPDLFCGDSVYLTTLCIIEYALHEKLLIRICRR